MKITPIDIQQQQFRVKWRGFDMQEVDVFLDVVAREMEDVVRERDDLRDEVDRLRRDLASYQANEDTLKETLITLQRVADQMKTAAENEAKAVVAQAEFRAERIVAEARVKVDEMLAEARERVRDVGADLADLRGQRDTLEAALRATLLSHLRLLDTTGRPDETPGRSGRTDEARRDPSDEP